MSENPFHIESITCAFPIWKIEAIPSLSLLIIEQRDDLLRKVSFSVYDYAKQSFLWRDISFRENWWITLCGTSGHDIIFKVYENQDNPDQVTYYSAAINSFDSLHLAKEDFLLNDTISLLYPFQYAEGEADFALVAEFINQKFGKKALLGLEYLECFGHIIISYYDGNPASFNNWLAVFSGDGNCLLHEIMATNLRGIGVNTFFIATDRLFFVKNRTELVTFRIV